MRNKTVSIILAVAVLVGFTPNIDFAASKAKITLKTSTITDTTIQLTWNKVAKAKKYVIYGSKLGQKFKKITTVKSKKAKKYTVKKINKKPLRKGQQYRFYIIAYSSKAKIAKSKTVKAVAEKKVEPMPIPDPDPEPEIEPEPEPTPSGGGGGGGGGNNPTPTPDPGPTPSGKTLEEVKAEAIETLSSEAHKQGNELSTEVQNLLTTAIEAINNTTSKVELASILAMQLKIIRHQLDKEDAGEFLCVGGYIFYVNQEALTNNGSTYTFYNANKEEISSSAWSIDASGNPTGLEEAKYYKVQGVRTSSEDAFFVYATQEGVVQYGGIYKYQDDPLHKGEGVEWGAYNTAVGTLNDGLGKGRINSEIALSSEASFKTENIEKENESIWTWLKRLNDDEFNLCDDWYIGTMAEHEKLIYSKAPGAEVYKAYKIWSSQEVENSKIQVYVWINNKSYWATSMKSQENGKVAVSEVIAFRSF